MGTVTSMRKGALQQPLEIATWRQDQDLREVSQSEDILWYWVKECKLRDGQAALFSNKSETRFRIVARYNDMPMLIILPVAASYALRRQLYAKIAEWLVNSFTTRRGVARDLIRIEVKLAA
jgi:hypothetical protein